MSHTIDVLEEEIKKLEEENRELRLIAGEKNKELLARVEVIEKNCEILVTVRNLVRDSDSCIDLELKLREVLKL